MTHKALLFYGIIIEIDKTPWAEQNLLWDDYLCKNANLIQPTGPYVEHLAEYKQYEHSKHVLIKKYGCSVEVFGNKNNSSEAIIVSDSLNVACREFPEILDPKYITIDKQWEPRLIEFCQMMRINCFNPNWYLVSYCF